MNVTMKKCTGVWSTQGGEGCFTCSDLPFWFSLVIATEHSIFKSACFKSQLALQCYPSSLFTAEQQWGWYCFEPKNMLQESKSPPWISPVPLPFGKAASGRNDEIQSDAASIVLDGRCWQEDRAAKWGNLKCLGKSWDALDQIQSKSLFFRIARWSS